MVTSAVGSTQNTSQTTTSGAAQSVSGLTGNNGQTDFLKLLIAQLSNQNPLDADSQNPQDFLAQLAQFQSLNATLKLGNDFKSYSLSSELMQSSSLIGKKVEYEDGSNQLRQGVVKSVRVEGGTCKVLVGDELIELSKITGVSNNDSGN